MTSAPIPINEAQRLDALRSLDILDTHAEERFDRLTRLALRVFDVPIATIGFIDADRQWFKSTHGLPSRDIPRDQTFCAHAILTGDIAVVPDTLNDHRFRNHPLVTGSPGIRFYAAHPLDPGDGLQLGTLAIMDTRPRSLGEEEKGLLRDLARLVEQELSLTRLATIDALTQLSNRRGFCQLGERALGTCGRHGWPATLLHFDITDLRDIQDQHGRTEGDNALQAFADLLRGTLRNSDVVGRLDADVFAALLVDATIEDSEALLERLDLVVRAWNRRTRRGYTLRYRPRAVGFDPARHAHMSDLLADGDRKM